MTKLFSDVPRFVPPFDDQRRAVEVGSEARYVEEHKAMLAWEGPEESSDEERVRVTAAMSALGHEIDCLAVSETAPVYLRKFKAIRDELQAHGFTQRRLPPGRPSCGETKGSSIRQAW